MPDTPDIKPQVTPAINRHRDLSRPLLFALHIVVIAASMLLIVIISIDTFSKMSLISDQRFLAIQFWLCILFLIDVIVDWINSPRKKRHVVELILFIAICIPYINLVDLFHIQVTSEMHYWLRIIPMIRGVYVFAVITSRLNSYYTESMFLAYIMFMIIMAYFSSMLFYVEEWNVNKQVPDYWTALWWAAMDLTTAGCYINPVTETGKVLSVVLSACGIILFPVFTVYISTALTRNKKRNNS